MSRLDTDGRRVGIVVATIPVLVIVFASALWIVAGQRKPVDALGAMGGAGAVTAGLLWLAGKLFPGGREGS